jgi:predicted acetyltransferase
VSDPAGLHLELPSRARREAFLAMAREFHEAGEHGWPHGARKENRIAIHDFEAFLAREQDLREGRNLPEGYVPGVTYWPFDGDEILGTAQLRLELNAHLRNYGGHIGYCIRPSRRRQGYMKRVLPLVLDQAARAGIQRVLITCRRENIASARVIESAGGQFEDERIDPARNKTLRRYWIDHPGR